MTMKRHCHNCWGYEKGVCEPRKLKTHKKSTCKLFILKSRPSKVDEPERPSTLNCEKAPDCVEDGVKTCNGCVSLKNAQEAWDREFA